MEILHTFFSFIMHLDQHLVTFVSHYGAWTYVLLFLIIFCETGLVITPILPGDSLLFAAGTIAASTSDAFNIHVLLILLITASILGNALNYLIGRFIGPKIFHSPKSLFFNKQYLDKAHLFYEKFGGKTIILARFIPIIRTFAPFIAGIASMSYKRFFLYNISGAILWIGGLLYISYFFSHLPIIKEHFSTIILAIIGLSLLPPIIEIMRHYVIKRFCRS